MAIKSTVMIPASSTTEFGILITHKNGTSEIVYVSKDFESLDKRVHELVTVRTNSSANGRHFFIAEHEQVNTFKFDVSVIEIAPNYPDQDLKWDAKDFIEAYLDFHQTFRFHPGAITRKVAFSTRPSLVTFESFVKFVHQAYKSDYNKWKMVDSDLAWVRKTFAVPTLP